MGLGTNHVTITKATAASRTYSNSAFVPELWVDEVVASYKSNLVMPQLVVTMPFTGQKGDTVHIPRPVRGEASAKTAETQVVLIANQEVQSAYVINEHWEYSRLIEDIVKIQASDRLRQFYTDDAGFALAKRVDTTLHAEGAKFAGADASPYVAGSAYSKAVIGTPTAGALVAWSAAANANAGNAAALTDEGIRLLIRELDDNDVPSMGRVLVIPPVEKKNLLGIGRFTEQAFVGSGDSIRNGKVGDVYGVEIFVSTRCATVADGGAATDQRACLMFQKEALLLIEQMKPRAQTQYKQEYLSDLFTTDVLFDAGLLRPEGGIAIVVPA
jgi:N4-gp56 family major capsid protein